MHLPVRGPIVDWYPYLFGDPRHQGYVPMTIGWCWSSGSSIRLAVVALGESSSRWRDADELDDEVTWLSR
ncbi:hypothetical protein ACQP1G_14305 [Nocardia sp. CA-107356]|uniref:hypothetical protein n=1 Tax=Nocardia sp. CA-107356 TaxID=3239972 RepID=UPI003D927B59